MKKNEFYQEVMDSKICPPNFQEAIIGFQAFQDLAWNTLKFFHRICEDNGIRYQLAFGSLLGAIRDGGQIPWDYDVDVFVLSEDRQKLVQALINESNSEYYFVCTEVDEKCRNEMVRLCPKGYSSDRLHVDVFFLAGVPNDSDECATFIKRIRYLCRARYYKLVDVRSEYKGHNRAKIYVLLKKIQYLFFDYNQAHDEYIELSGRYLIKDSKNVVNANMYAGAYYIPTEWIIDTYLININGAQFRIPIHYHDILTMLFGNYMNVPTLENRINEMMTSYKNLKLYSKIEE